MKVKKVIHSKSNPLKVRNVKDVFGSARDNMDLIKDASALKKKTEKGRNLRIYFEIETDDGKSYLNFGDFDRALIALVTEREQYNFVEHQKIWEQVKQTMRENIPFYYPENEGCAEDVIARLNKEFPYDKQSIKIRKILMEGAEDE